MRWIFFLWFSYYLKPCKFWRIFIYQYNTESNKMPSREFQICRSCPSCQDVRSNVLLSGDMSNCEVELCQSNSPALHLVYNMTCHNSLKSWRRLHVKHTLMVRKNGEIIDWYKKMRKSDDRSDNSIILSFGNGLSFRRTTERTSYKRNWPMSPFSELSDRVEGWLIDQHQNTSSIRFGGISK